MISRSHGEEDDAGWSAHGRVLPGELYFPGVAVDAKAREAIAALVAGIQEGSGGVDLYVSRIVTHGRGFAHVGEPAFGVQGKDGDGGVQPIGRVKEPLVGREQDLGGEVCSLEARG